MTKSSRKMDRIAGRPKWISTNYKCEECGKNLRKIGPDQFVCISCGLEQQVKK